MVQFSASELHEVSCYANFKVDKNDNYNREMPAPIKSLGARLGKLFVHQLAVFVPAGGRGGLGIDGA